jgi:hypothetical protein
MQKSCGRSPMSHKELHCNKKCQARRNRRSPSPRRGRRGSPRRRRRSDFDWQEHWCLHGRLTAMRSVRDFRTETLVSDAVWRESSCTHVHISSSQLAQSSEVFLGRWGCGGCAGHGCMDLWGLTNGISVLCLCTNLCVRHSI